MSAAKKLGFEERFSQLEAILEERMGKIERALTRLADMHAERGPDGKPKAKTAVSAANPDTALRARVGLAAARYNMPREKWIELHGMRDRMLPRAADAWVSTLKPTKTKRGRKAKAKA